MHAAAAVPSRRTATLLALILAAVPAGRAAALDINGFLPPRGNGDVAFSYTTESYDEFWAGDQEVSEPALGEVEVDSLALWLQWGLTDDLALVANLPYVDAGSDGFEGFGESDLQDLSALLKYRFARFGSGAVRHSLVAGAGVRTPASDYEDDLPVDVGDGTTDALLRFVYQVEAGNLYFSQQVGWDVRSEDAPDNYPLYTELGYTAGPVTVTAFYSRLFADGGTDIGDPGFTFPSNQEEYEKVGAKLYGRVTERLGLFGGGFTTLDGRNTGKFTGFSAGGVLRF